MFQLWKTHSRGGSRDKRNVTVRRTTLLRPSCDYIWSLTGRVWVVGQIEWLLRDMIHLSLYWLCELIISCSLKSYSVTPCEQGTNLNPHSGDLDECLHWRRITDTQQRSHTSADTQVKTGRDPWAKLNRGSVCMCVCVLWGWGRQRSRPGSHQVTACLQSEDKGRVEKQGDRKMRRQRSSH